MDYTKELGSFCGPDEAAARGALDRLATPARRFIRAVVTDRLSRDDVEEVIQTALLKAWVNRLSFVNRGQAAWYGWLKRIARNACVDLFRARGEETGEPIPEDIEDDELPLIERFMTEIMGRELFELADSVWLEVDASSPEHQDRSLIAVQLLYFDGWSFEDVLSLLSDVRPDAAPLTRKQIDSWLEAPSNLRWVIYQELLYPPDRLAAHLLGLQPHEGVRELELALISTRSGACPDAVYRNWTVQEAEAILWRYYREASIEETAQQIKDLPPEALMAVFANCALLFPFRSKCEYLCGWLDEVDVNEVGRD
jgi:DNA-directed RNA polymerase specialized sigma24 family protein